MSKRITTDGRLPIGLDLGDRFTEGRVLGETGEVQWKIHEADRLQGGIHFGSVRCFSNSAR